MALAGCFFVFVLYSLYVLWEKGIGVRLVAVSVGNDNAEIFFAFPNFKGCLVYARAVSGILYLTVS